MCIRGFIRKTRLTHSHKKHNESNNEVHLAKLTRRRNAMNANSCFSAKYGNLSVSVISYHVSIQIRQILN